MREKRVRIVSEGVINGLKRRTTFVRNGVGRFSDDAAHSRPKLIRLRKIQSDSDGYDSGGCFSRFTSGGTGATSINRLLSCVQ